MYGENGGLLRAELATLLHQHRTQQRLGGPGIHPAPKSTTAEREALAEQIGRYRHVVLVWCLQAVRAVNPHIDLYATSGRTRGPAEELRYRLTAAIEASAGLPWLEELATEQQSTVVETWRQAARAATFGEHDFGAGLNYSHLSDEQCMTVLKDAADITSGLVALDRHYTGTPGWQTLKDPDQIGRAAATCAAFAAYEKPDYTVDLRGWRPPPNTVDGPALPSLSGVLQAEHNLLVHLTKFPNAHNLRLVLDSQRVLSHEASLRVRDFAPDLADIWQARTQTYTTLVRETRDLGGKVGSGGPATAEGANAISRLRRLPRRPTEEPTSLRHLNQLFTRIDARISDIIEHGASERLYFLRVTLPRVTDHSTGLIKPVRQRYVPISSPLRTDLIEIVRTQLRPPPVPSRPPAGAGRSRAGFEAAIVHRPDRPGISPAIWL